MEEAMLTLAIVFLIAAITAGVFGLMVAGPVALIAFFVFVALFLGTITLHYVREHGRRRPFK